MNLYNQIDNGALLLCQFENKFIENLLNFEQQQNIKTENQNWEVGWCPLSSKCPFFLYNHVDYVLDIAPYSIEWSSICHKLSWCILGPMCKLILCGSWNSNIHPLTKRIFLKPFLFSWNISCWMVLKFSPPRCVIHQKRKHLEAGFVFLSRIMVKHFQKILTLNREWQSVAQGYSRQHTHWVWTKSRDFFIVYHYFRLCQDLRGSQSHNVRLVHSCLELSILIFMALGALWALMELILSCIL